MLTLFRAARLRCAVGVGRVSAMVLAKSASNTRQTSTGKAGGDIDFAVFYLFADAVGPLGKKGDVRNRVASVFSGRPRFRFGLARALHEPPTSGGYVASHYAEPRPTPPV